LVIGSNDPAKSAMRGLVRGGGMAGV